MENITSHANKIPKKDLEEKVQNPRPILDVKNIGEMIISSIDKQSDKAINENRLLEYKRLLLNFLFNNIAKKSVDKKTNKLDDQHPLIEDENLILYTFFISYNEQFNFEWSYLLSKLDEIEKFMLRFREHINYVCNDISELLKCISFENDTVFIIDDYLKISYSHNNKSLNAEIQFKEIHKILNCKKDFYTLKILYGSVISISLDRTSKIDAKKASEKIQELIKIIIKNNQ